MRKLLFAIALLGLSVAPLRAQQLTITGNSITDVSGAPFTGRIGFTPVAGPSGPPISATAGGGGQILPFTRYFNVVAGVLQSGATLADTATTSPVNLCYRVTYRYAGLPTNEADNGVIAPCFQPSSAVLGSTNLSTHISGSPVLQVVQTGPRGLPGQIVIGSVSTLSPGTPATVVNAGTTDQAILNFGIPQGVAGTMNGLRDATTLTGSDLGAQVNNGFAGCSDAAPCHVIVPPGVYSYATPILLPRRTYGLQLTIDRNAHLTYTGTGDAIGTQPQVNGTTNQGGTLIDGGGTLTGTSAANSGIHLRPGKGYTVKDLTVTGFTSGDGVWIDGANTVLLLGNTVTGNLNGLHLTGNMCNASNACNWDINSSHAWVNANVASAGGYAPNAVHVYGNSLNGNQHWGVLEMDVVGGSVSPAYGNSYIGNDLELNGKAGAAYGAFASCLSDGARVSDNYFEASPREVLLGCSGDSGVVVPTGYTATFGGTAYKPKVEHNYFTGGAATEIAMPYAGSPAIEDNVETASGSTCFIDSSYSSGDIRITGNQYTAASQVCQGGVGGGYLLNYLEYGDANGKRFAGKVRVDGTFTAATIAGNGAPSNLSSGAQIQGGSRIFSGSGAPSVACVVGGDLWLNTGAATGTYSMYVCHNGTWAPMGAIF